MKVTCLQMDVLPSQPERNFSHAAQLIADAMAESPDVIVLPESWDISFLPCGAVPELYRHSYHRTIVKIGALAKLHNVHIVAGSVTNSRDGKLYNTCCIFDRQGNLTASYDKIHLFTHAGEDARYGAGNSLCCFTLDGVPCGAVICYDIRFPELIRTMCLKGVDVLFVLCQWPKARIDLLQTLCAARAIENQMYVVCCNACGTAGENVCGGSSAIFAPSGSKLAEAGEAEQSITADCDAQKLQALRKSFPVFRDRRPDLYRL